jgi:steroid 5-alpha reductase family enzyme
MVLPIHAVYVLGDMPLGWIDWLASGACLVILAFESIADVQMRRFQARKKEFRRGSIPGDHETKQGFVSTGLFGFSRHPAQMFEILMWFSIWCFSCIVTGTVFNWYVACPLSVFFLIHVTSRLHAQISRGKYRLYSEYEKVVSTNLMLWPHKPFEWSESSKLPGG